MKERRKEGINLLMGKGNSISGLFHARDVWLSHYLKS